MLSLGPNLYFVSNSWARVRFRYGSTYSTMNLFFEANSYSRINPCRSGRISPAPGKKMTARTGFLRLRSRLVVCELRANFCSRE